MVPLPHNPLSVIKERRKGDEPEWDGKQNTVVEAKLRGKSSWREAGKEGKRKK